VSNGSWESNNDLDFNLALLVGANSIGLSLLVGNLCNLCDDILLWLKNATEVWGEVAEQVSMNNKSLQGGIS